MGDGTAFIPLEKIHDKIRKRFPLIDRDSQGNRRVYLNTGAGSLMVDSAVEASAEAFRKLNPMPGTICPGEISTDRLHGRAREIVAEFLHAREGREISFHFSATAALFTLAYSMRSVLGFDHNLIVTDLDHMANISPWETIWGEEMGCEIRRARVGDDGTLDVDHLLSLVDARTGVIALTMASNGFGSIVPLSGLIRAVRKIKPDVMISVDAVHHALHGSIDVRGIDCDFLVFSGYKVFGPMLGVLYGKSELLEELKPYRVETNKDEHPFKFEMGMLNNGSLAALVAALEYLLWIADETGGNGRPGTDGISRFVSAFGAIEEYERRLTHRVLRGLKDLPPERFTLYGISDPGRASERDPTFAFEISGESAGETKRRLWEDHAIQIADGNHYSAAVTRHLKKQALCRASFAHYDTFETVDRFLEAVGSLTRRG